MPDLNGPIDPRFDSPFIAKQHEALMRKKTDLSHLDPGLQEKIYSVIREYWLVFDERGVFIPVKNYECMNDTGNARPIAIKKILYGKRETVIMQKCISALAKVGHIRQIMGGSWLFKALLAAKPHQEHVINIEDFIWRFCVNYLPQNGVTRIIAYTIPHCDLAVFNEIGLGKWMIMFNAPMGYHQLAVALASQEKLAFQGVNAIKWTYNVMPFRPTNGLATFINFIHDLASVWKDLASQNGISIDDNTNTRIIVDDIVNWANTPECCITYMQCILQVCQAYNLSLTLDKSHFFPQ